MKKRETEASKYFGVLGLAQTQVRLHPPTPLWAQLYAEEAARLRIALEPMLVKIEHYGSTSLIGIQAKPILDILAGIEHLDDGPALIAPLAALGYDYAGADVVPGHHIFGKGEARTHLLHIVEYGSPIWREALQFRDALRANLKLAHEYEALKIALSEQYAECRAEYTAAKASFIQSVLARLEAP
jgi:GrpB-like predicted nucleotidyltransferase (UPF0157 family)